MSKGLKKLLNGPKFFNRKNFCINYDRTKIAKQLAVDILSLSLPTTYKKLIVSNNDIL